MKLDRGQNCEQVLDYISSMFGLLGFGGFRGFGCCFNFVIIVFILGTSSDLSISQNFENMCWAIFTLKLYQEDQECPPTSRDFLDQLSGSKGLMCYIVWETSEENQLNDNGCRQHDHFQEDMEYPPTSRLF